MESKGDKLMIHEHTGQGIDFPLGICLDHRAGQEGSSRLIGVEDV